MLQSSRVAGWCLVLLLMYYEVYRWIPLGRWNRQFRWPVQNDQFYPDVVIGLLLMFFVVAFFRSWRPAMWFAVALLVLWVGVHFFDWWRPYMQNSASKYARYSFYASHMQILPVIDHHYPPDGGHALLDFLLYPTWVICFVVSSSKKKPRVA